MSRARPYTVNQIKSAACGRWPEILASLGIDRRLLDTRKHQPCPYCGGKDRYRFTDHQGTGGFICNQCTQQGGSGFDLLMLVFGWDFQTALGEVAALLGYAPHSSAQKPVCRPAEPTPRTAAETPVCDKIAVLLQGWHEAAQIAPDCPVTGYLAARGLDGLAVCRQAERFSDGRNTGDDTGDGSDTVSGYPLRYSFSEYWTGGQGGALQIGTFHAVTAAVTDPQGRLKGLHRTYLQERLKDGGSVWRKLVLLHPQTGEPLPAKKMYARYSGAMKGAAVRFSPPDEQGRLIVAEGIETALAATELFGLPAAAALSAGGLAAFEWPSETRELYICADNDPNRTGINAAEALARRAVQSGIKAHIWQPETAGFDALDELNARRAAV